MSGSVQGRVLLSTPVPSPHLHSCHGHHVEESQRAERGPREQVAEAALPQAPAADREEAEEEGHAIVEGHQANVSYPACLSPPTANSSHRRPSELLPTPQPPHSPNVSPQDLVCRGSGLAAPGRHVTVQQGARGGDLHHGNGRQIKSAMQRSRRHAMLRSATCSSQPAAGGGCGAWLRLVSTLRAPQSKTSAAHTSARHRPHMPTASGGGSAAAPRQPPAHAGWQT